MLLALLLGGCSLRLSYGFLDWWIGWQVAGYVHLDRDQRRALGDAADHFHRWHRSQELPRYAASARRFGAALAAESIAVEQLRALQGELYDHWQRSAARLVAPAAALLATLSEQQVAEIAERLAERREVLWRERVELAPEAIARQRREQLEDLLSELVGRLSKRQRALVDARLAEFLPSRALMFAHAEREDARFLALLSRRQQPEHLHRALADLLLHSRAARSPEYRAVSAHNNALLLGLLAELHAGLSPKQHRHLARFFDHYGSTFEALAALDH